LALKGKINTASTTSIRNVTFKTLLEDLRCCLDTWLVFEAAKGLCHQDSKLDVHERLLAAGLHAQLVKELGQHPDHQGLEVVRGICLLEHLAEVVELSDGR